MGRNRGDRLLGVGPANGPCEPAGSLDSAGFTGGLVAAQGSVGENSSGDGRGPCRDPRSIGSLARSWPDEAKNGVHIDAGNKRIYPPDEGRANPYLLSRDRREQDCRADSQGTPGPQNSPVPPSEDQGLTRSAMKNMWLQTNDWPKATSPWVLECTNLPIKGLPTVNP